MESVTPFDLDVWLKKKNLQPYDYEQLASRQDPTKGVVLCCLTNRGQGKNGYFPVDAKLLEVDDDFTSADVSTLVPTNRKIRLLFFEKESALSELRKSVRIAIAGFEYLPLDARSKSSKQVQQKSNANQPLQLVVKNSAEILRIKRSDSAPGSSKRVKKTFPCFLELKDELDRSRSSFLRRVSTYCFVGKSKRNDDGSVEYQVFDFCESSDAKLPRSNGIVRLENSNGQPVVVMPVAKYDILLLREVSVRFDIAENRLEFSGELGKDGCEAAMFHVRQGKTKLPYAASSSNFTVTDEIEAELIDRRNHFERLRLRASSIGKPADVGELIDENRKPPVTLSKLGRGKYFDLVGKIVGIARSETRTVLRVWDGTKPGVQLLTCPYISADAQSQKAPDADVSVTMRSQLAELTMSKGYAVDIYVYDEHAAKADKFEVGSIVYLVNVHVYRQGGFTDYSATLHGGGQNYKRGIYPVPEKHQKQCLQLIRPLLEEWNYVGEDDLEMSLQIYSQPSQEMDVQGQNAAGNAQENAEGANDVSEVAGVADNCVQGGGVVEPGNISQREVIDMELENTVNRSASFDESGVVGPRCGKDFSGGAAVGNESRGEKMVIDIPAIAPFSPDPSESFSLSNVQDEGTAMMQSQDVPASSQESFKTAVEYLSQQIPNVEAQSNAEEDPTESYSTTASEQSQLELRFIDSTGKENAALGSSEATTDGQLGQTRRQSRISLSGLHFRLGELRKSAAAPIPGELRGVPADFGAAHVELSSNPDGRGSRGSSDNGHGFLMETEQNAQTTEEELYKNLDSTAELIRREFFVVKCEKPNISSESEYGDLELLLNLACPSCWEGFWMDEVEEMIDVNSRLFRCRCGVATKAGSEAVILRFELLGVDENDQTWKLVFTGDEVEKILKVTTEDFHAMLGSRDWDMLEYSRNIWRLYGHSLKVEGYVVSAEERCFFVHSVC